MSKNIKIAIQVRLSSKRLPAKALLKFRHTTLLGNILSELMEAGYQKEDIYILTSTDETDDAIMQYFSEFQIFRGALENVFDRYLEFSLFVECSHILRLTGDNPFPPVAIMRYLSAHPSLSEDVGLLTTRYLDDENSVKSTVEKGNNVDIINTDKLKKYSTYALTDYDKEHVIPIFLSQNDCQTIDASELTGKNKTVDTFEDYVRLLKNV